jgi:hypothetical protein
MKHLHGTFTFAVFLLATLMAVSEAPEILSLTDDVSNDCESVQIERQSPRRCIVEDSTRQATSSWVLFSLSTRENDALAHNFLLSSSSRSPDSLLLLLTLQRK